MGLTGRLIGFEVREKKGTGFVRCGFSKTLILENHRRGFSPGEMDRVLDYAQDNKLDMIIRHPCNFGNEDARYVELKLIVTNGKCTNEEQGLDFWSAMVRHAIDNLTENKSIYDGLTIRFEAREMKDGIPIEGGFYRSIIVDDVIFDFPNEEAEQLYSETYDYVLEHMLDLIIRSPKTLKNSGENGYLEYKPIPKPVE